MSFPKNTVYAGKVGHKRLSPITHEFRYRVFYLLIDLDAFEAPSRQPWCLSLDRFNLFSIYQKDFGDNSRGGLKDHIKQQLRAAGIKPHKVFMLTMPRILGYAFNPITLFYSFDISGNISAVIYEVHNTFGENHSYLIPVGADHNGIPDHGADKNLYVSPFYDVSGKYRLRVTPPGPGLSLLIHYLDDDNNLRMTADMNLARQKLTAKNLLALFFKIPFVTLKVITAIHFQALRLWLKRVRLVPRPAPPSRYSLGAEHKH